MRLSDEQIRERLAGLDLWEHKEGRLVKRYGFPDFRAALAFVVMVGLLAERADHHPDITLGYGSVEVLLYSHDAEGVTERDFLLAEQIDAL